MAAPAEDPAPSSVGSAAAGVDDDSRVATTVRLLHRRRGWAWTAGGSLIALVAFFAIGQNVSPNPTGAISTIFAVIIIALVVLFLAALFIVGLDTARLRRLHPADRASAARRVSHHPLAKHPFRTPQHRPSHAFVWVLITLWIGLAVLLLPDQVNAVAYAAGAGKTVDFDPQSYYQSCSRGGCSDYTEGILLTHPPVSATWQHYAALGHPFPVRQPVWDGWGSPDLMDGTSVGRSILASLIFDVPTLLILFVLARKVWRRLGRGRHTTVSWAAQRRSS